MISENLLILADGIQRQHPLFHPDRPPGAHGGRTTLARRSSLPRISAEGVPGLILAARDGQKERTTASSTTCLSLVRARGAGGIAGVSGVAWIDERVEDLFAVRRDAEATEGRVNLPRSMPGKPYLHARERELASRSMPAPLFDGGTVPSGPFGWPQLVGETAPQASDEIGMGEWATPSWNHRSARPS
jgi:hypothetical protein